MHLEPSKPQVQNVTPNSLEVLGLPLGMTGIFEVLEEQFDDFSCFCLSKSNMNKHLFDVNML